MELKTCRKCGEEKDSLEGFSVDSRAKSGRNSTCRSCSSAASSVWRRANPEKTRTSNREWRESNRDKTRAASARWYRANLEAAKLYSAQRKQEYPERVRAIKAKRRALKAACRGSHYTASDVEALLLTQQGRCAYCLLELDGSYHVDHIVPLSRGGGNGPENICLACASCNLSKRNKLLESEWVPSVKLSLDKFRFVM